MAKRDCYDVLGVTKSASNDEIKKAYRKLALKFHPDKTKGDKASEEKFKEASEAYHILSDEKRKTNYDQFGHAAFEGAGGGGQGFEGFDTSSFSDIFGLWYNILFAVLIIVFTYFYTAITVPTNKMADDLKRSGGFVPGVRPGTETADFLDRVMSQITFPGSLFLAAVAVLPAVVYHLFGMQQGWALFYGGTSLLIMVGVAIDTIQQINAYLLNGHYDGLMKTGSKRKTAGS